MAGGRSEELERMRQMNKELKKKKKNVETIKKCYILQVIPPE